MSLRIRISPAIAAVRRLYGAIGRQLWARATAFSLAAALTALAGALLGPILPEIPGLSPAASSVDGILTILASSMLAVTTFSLSVMVSAYSAAAAQGTPRATRLLVEDRFAQNALSTFLGSFLFSIVGLIGLAAEIYTDQGRVILFLATLGVVAIIVVTFLQWIDRIGDFGRTGDTVQRVENAATAAAQLAGRRPRLGAALEGIDADDLPEGRLVCARSTGVIRTIYMESLAAIANSLDADIRLAVRPGEFVAPETPLAVIEIDETALPEDAEPREAAEEEDAPSDPADAADAEADKAAAREKALAAQAEKIDTAAKRVCACVVVAPARDFEGDPRYGLTVLSEIASRALSPAVNDPGTAIAVLDAGVRALLAWAAAGDDPDAPLYERVGLPALDPADMLDDLFTPIARDGAGVVEVQRRVQEGLKALAQAAPDRLGPAARAYARDAAARADEALAHTGDRRAVAAAAAWAARP